MGGKGATEKTVMYGVTVKYDSLVGATNGLVLLSIVWFGL